MELYRLKDLLTESAEKWGGEVCSLNPCIRIYRYRKDQFINQHCKLFICLLVGFIVCLYLSLAPICLVSPFCRPTYKCKSFEG